MSAPSSSLALAHVLLVIAGALIGWTIRGVWDEDTAMIEAMRQAQQAQASTAQLDEWLTDLEQRERAARYDRGELVE